MVVVEELEEPEFELATGSVTHVVVEEDESDADGDGDGFQTASEGRESSGEESSDDEATDDEGAKPREIGGRDAEEQLRSEEEEKQDRQTRIDEASEAKAEEQPRSEEEEKQDRQKRIDEASEAKAQGNSLYVERKYAEALLSYERGLIACPLKDPEDSDVKAIRAVLYCNRAACYANLENSAGAVKESTEALELNPNYVKALVRRYQAREKLENYEEAIADVNRVLELDPGNSQARVSLRHLIPLAEEKREKLKNEMIDKLKDAGNSILGRFGMSLDNFKTVQDPNTGSYSIQFNR